MNKERFIGSMPETRHIAPVGLVERSLLPLLEPKKVMVESEIGFQGKGVEIQKPKLKELDSNLPEVSVNIHPQEVGGKGQRRRRLLVLAPAVVLTTTACLSQAVDGILFSPTPGASAVRAVIGFLPIIYSIDRFWAKILKLKWNASRSSKTAVERPSEYREDNRYDLRESQHHVGYSTNTKDVRKSAGKMLFMASSSLFLVSLAAFLGYTNQAVGWGIFATGFASIVIKFTKSERSDKH